MKTSMRNLLLNLAAIGLLALFLVWAETNLDGYKVQILNLIAVNAILALSLNLIYGFTGMFSLGHAGFMAIGAYVSALCRPIFQSQQEYRQKWQEIPSLHTQDYPGAYRSPGNQHGQHGKTPAGRA